jgi:peptidyl-prolyl cis-trans isomerase A (cyclophilin A)
MKRSVMIAATVLFVSACEKAPAPPADKAPAAPATAAAPAPPSEAILHPDPVKLFAAAPDSFTVHMLTSKGPIDLTIHRDWSPKGADRFYYLVSNGYYDGIRFFRVLDGFIAQFGMAGDTAVGHVWHDRPFDDDPVKHSNKRGTVTFAKTGMPNSRGTQLFINFGDNSRLDAIGFSPLGEVTGGMPVADSLYKGYGETPVQDRITAEGNSYLAREFPKLDYIVTARVTQEWKKTK